MKSWPHSGRRVTGTRMAGARLAVPIRSLAQRFMYAGLIVAAIGLLMLGKVDSVAVEKARVQMTDAVAPILDMVSQPVAMVEGLVADGRAFLNVYEENARLREERDRLMQWQAAALKLEAENRILREFLEVVPAAKTHVVTGRVIGDTGGAFAHSVIVNVGRRDGVRKGRAAVTPDGLIGRVTDVGGRSARVLLITDLNARIPVLIESSGTRAIMAGTNKAQPRLLRLPIGAVVSVGDRVVTSGHAGVFPPGLPVGQVTATGEGGILIQPFVDLNRVQYARILDYDSDGILRLTPDPEDARTAVYGPPKPGPRRPSAPASNRTAAPAPAPTSDATPPSPASSPAAEAPPAPAGER